MYYPMPKKIQFVPSTAKWSIASMQSVLLLVGLHELRTSVDAEQTELLQNLSYIVKKAKALEIPIVDLYGDDAMQGMQRLGEILATHPQLIIAGQITPLIKQVLPHFMSVTEQLCIVDDAILLATPEKHIQWVDSLTAKKAHHMNTASLTRLWSLSAPKDLILSEKGILLAIAEHLDMDVLSIDPSLDLRCYGLDSVAIVDLVALWRANGAEIRYEDFLKHPSLEMLMAKLKS